MKAVLYIVTNSVNGKRYVGVTSRDVRRRFSEHLSAAKAGTNNGAFHRAIRKYGGVVFSMKIVNEFFDDKDAKAAEIAYIAECAPEYNSTAGGDGRLGVPMSSAAKVMLKAVHAGNKYRTGMMHSEETRRWLSENAKENIVTFKKFSHLGPEKLAKKVRCVDDQMIWDSIKSAADAYGVSRSLVSEVCLKKRYRKTAGGRRFEFVEAGQ